MSNEIVGPRPVVSNRFTENANAMIKKAGILLKETATENTRLQETCVDLQEKLSSSQRRNALYEVAIDAANARVINSARIVETVDQWAKESHDVQYYRDRVRARTDLSFADTNGAEAPTKQSMDTTQSVPQNHNQSRHQAAQDRIRAALHTR